MSGTVTDVRDVLGIDPGALEPRQPPLKKQRTVEKRPDGITRELYALLGENAPPVAVVEHRFKDKPKFLGSVAPWREQTFKNPARKDGLELKHWVRQSSLQETSGGGGVDGDQEGGGQQTLPLDYQFAKFNIKINLLEYSDAEYDAVLKDDDWSRQETDYLFRLIKEYDLRWVVIADRFEFEGKDRTMEDLKASAMHYNKEQEVERKRIVQMQLYRTPAEVEHEQHLIAELRRIHDSHQQLLEEREELFNRLDYPQSTGSIAAYQGSQGLATLAQNILNTDRNKKRKSIVAPPGQPAEKEEPPAKATPAAAAAAAASPAVSRQGSIAEPARAHGHQRNESTASASAPTPLKDKNKSNIKQLSKAEEAQYNLSHHEKLQPGVFFRTMKMNLPKANSFINKSPAIMAELNIPQILSMPTSKTCAKYEVLAKEIAALMDIRKQLEKVEQETRVFKTQEAMGGDRSKRSASVLSDVSRSSKRPKKEK
ncbi:swr complex subunit [Orbilia oligospora]|uniref:SWR1-complex protein 4 n=1 Tax=Orbilia oligospora TaxID=2813651 RepID=A0A6G1MKJ5_ORBOL|nr:swr complex subunit [Orbilia oligospora]KAF3261829.1 swr complex subunit [Orbilia oligospora]